MLLRLTLLGDSPPEGLALSRDCLRLGTVLDPGLSLIEEWPKNQTSQRVQHAHGAVLAART
ncbi:MAG: hypothetical protein AAFV45_05595 [Pseudomonadota bacterium]